MGSLWTGDTCRCCLATIQNQTKPKTSINVIMQRISAKELLPLILDVDVHLLTQHLCRLLWLLFLMLAWQMCQSKEWILLVQQ